MVLYPYFINNGLAFCLFYLFFFVNKVLSVSNLILPVCLNLPALVISALLNLWLFGLANIKQLGATEPLKGYV